MKNECTVESFLKDVAKHEIEILLDDGVRRHIKLKAPKTWDQGFEIITWPGSLCYSGDMGTYVFRRIEDMFEFFRQPADHAMRINRPYWAEKVEAQDRDGVKKYSEAKFRANVENWLNDAEASAEVRAAVAEEVLCSSDDEHEAYRAAYEFEHPDLSFTDFFEVDNTEFTYRYTWCCFALVWAIAKYDESKAAAAAKAAA